jgi:hypothetical protein
MTVQERAFNSFEDMDMCTQKLLRVSYCAADAALALKTLVPAMDAGFNIHTHQGDLCVGGSDAHALARLLSKRLRHRLKPDSATSAKKAAAPTPLRHSYQKIRRPK